MKRSVIFFVFLIMIFDSSFVLSQITGEATQTMGMNISVTAYFPLLTIISPKNNTYITNESLLLNYSVNNEDTIWYNIDGSSNITITPLIYFNTSQGSHTLYLYANSSFGNITSRKITFFINSSIFSIPISETSSPILQGNSTDFLIYSYKELQNLSNIILENIEYGKILFNSPINLTDDANPNDGTIDIESNINISYNRIEINSNTLPNFNKSATLWLSGLSFSNPRILKDGSVCPLTICTKESYSNNMLKFNVTGFSIYSSEETPVDSESPSSSGGGGGGSRTIIEKETPAKGGFSISEKEIKISLKQGEVMTKIIIIKNTDNKKLQFNISISNLNDFIRIREDNFELAPGEQKIIMIDFIARKNTLPDLYLGKIIVKERNAEKEILIVIEIESFGVLLDIKIEIPLKFKKIIPGTSLISEIKIFNFGKNKGDIIIEYEIRDQENRNIIKETETIAIETQISFTKEFHIPENIKQGIYFIYIKAITSEGKVASSTAQFEIVKETIQKEKIYIVVIVFLIVIGSLLAYYALRQRMHHTIYIVRRAHLREIIKKR